MPAFARSAMDGYAVRARDTFGAGESSPAYLQLHGEVRMGVAAVEPLPPGCARKIHTGAMVPPGADAVVMVEATNAHGDVVEVLAAVAPGEDVIVRGEDVAAGDLVVPAGAAAARRRAGGAGGDRRHGRRSVRAPAHRGALDRRRSRPGRRNPAVG